MFVESPEGVTLGVGRMGQDSIMQFLIMSLLSSMDLSQFVSYMIVLIVSICNNEVLCIMYEVIDLFKNLNIQGLSSNYLMVLG